MNEFKIGNVSTSSNAAANSLFQSSINTINQGVKGFTDGLQGIGEVAKQEQTKVHEKNFLDFAAQAANVTDIAGAEMFKQQAISMIKENPEQFGANATKALNIAETLGANIKQKELLDYEYTAKKQTAEDGALNTKERPIIDEANLLAEQGKYKEALALAGKATGTLAQSFKKEVIGKQKQKDNGRKSVLVDEQFLRAQELDDIKSFTDNTAAIYNDPNTSDEVKLKIVQKKSELLAAGRKLSPLEEAALTADIAQLNGVSQPSVERLATNQAEVASITKRLSVYNDPELINSKSLGTLTQVQEVFGEDVDALNSGVERVRGAAAKLNFSDKIGRDVTTADIVEILSSTGGDWNNWFGDDKKISETLAAHMDGLVDSKVKLKSLNEQVLIDKVNVQKSKLAVENYRLSVLDQKANDNSTGLSLNGNRDSKFFNTTQAALSNIYATPIIGKQEDPVVEETIESADITPTTTSDSDPLKVDGETVDTTTTTGQRVLEAANVSNVAKKELKAIGVDDYQNLNSLVKNKKVTKAFDKLLAIGEDGLLSAALEKTFKDADKSEAYKRSPISESLLDRAGNVEGTIKNIKGRAAGNDSISNAIDSITSLFSSKYENETKDRLSVEANTLTTNKLNALIKKHGNRENIPLKELIEAFNK